MNLFRHSLLVLILLLVLPAASMQAENKAPFVIPELKTWKGSEGSFHPDTRWRVVCASGESEVLRIADDFIADYKQMFGRGMELNAGRSEKGDFVFRLNPKADLPKEGYTIRIADKVEVTASSPVGLYWATRTLLQMSEQSADRSLPCGYIKDYPDYPVRGFMIDCGRKFIPMPFLRDYVKIMAYYKMNTLQIHLNDNGFKQFYEHDWDKTYSAFRLECDTYPGLAAEDGHYTKREFIDLQLLAEDCFVDIIPEIDAPAHSLAFSQYKPEIGSKEYGMDHLDLGNPETYRFLDALFAEYLEGDEPVFRGPRVNIGTDEYSNKDPKVVEQFRYFTDYYIKYVEKFGKQACVWGALTHAKGSTPVKSENVVMNLWHNPYAQPVDMIEQGYKLISIPDGLLYIVPAAGYYYDYLNTKYLYENWTPAHIGKEVFEEKHPAILGGMFAVWNDHVGNGISTRDIHHRVYPAMQTLAVKMWNPTGRQLSFEEFDKKRHLLSEAPGVNLLGRIGAEHTLVYNVETLFSGMQTPYEAVGYDYTVSFEIEGSPEKPGTVLLRSDDAVFYLADPVQGLIGFARDGYLNTFNYRIKPGRATLAIEGDNHSTRLYVNGKLVEEMDMRTFYFNEGKDKRNYVRTLVFPLKQVGSFDSRISNLKVYNYKIYAN